MCTKAQLEQISTQMADSYRRVYGTDVVRILLYGSYARGTNDSESDIDIAAIVHGNRLDLQKKLKTVWDDSTELGIANDVVISPVVIPNDEFEKYKTSLPYYQTILREGVAIG